MINLEEITIKVSPEIAEAYRQASKKEQEQIQLKNECRDVKDNKYLELAITGQAECIITGDQDLLILNPFREIPIVTVQEFLTIYQ